MKKYILVVIAVLYLPYDGSCQVNSDSSYTTIGLDLFVNRCFENIESVKILEESPLTKGTPFCSIATCLATLATFDQDPDVNRAIFSQLEKLAERLYEE
ncbi:MAG: hypothetical protein AAF399_25755, partial [Bacteroidota bacterium]